MIQGNIFGNAKRTESVERLKYATEDFDVTSALLESLIAIEDSFFNITKEHMTATHIAIKDGNMEILQEGFRDFVNSAVEFFKNMLKKFKEFMMKIFMYINAFIGNFEKFLERYKDKIRDLNPDFTMRGFNYEFKESVPQLDKIQMLVNNYNSELSDAKSMSKKEILEARDEFTSEENMGKIRGYVLGVNYEIRDEDLIKEAKRAYRSGDDEDVEIKVNKSKLSSTVAEYSELKKMTKTCNEQRDRIILLLESLKTFFERSATVNFKDGGKVVNADHIKINERGSGITREDRESFAYTSSTVEVLNVFYNYKWIQAKDIGAICVAAMTEKVAALRESMRQSERLIRKCIFNEKKLEDTERRVEDATYDL